MVGWLIFGAALMYLFPWIADALVSSELTHRWMTNLTRGGYTPLWGVLAGGVTLVATTIGNVIWYRRFDGKI